MKHLLITAYSCSSKSPCSSWAKRYINEPVDIISVPGGSSSQFRRKGVQARNDFPAWLEEQGHDPTNYERIAIITFSAGWGFIHELLKSSEAFSWIDTVMLLDGLHCNLAQLDERWRRLVDSARIDERALIMAHSGIIPPNYPSSTKTNETVYQLVGDPIEAYKINAPKCFAPPLTININGQHRTWTEFPKFTKSSVGSLELYSVEGNDAPTHILMARIVQEYLWRVSLAPRLNSGRVWCGSNEPTA